MVKSKFKGKDKRLRERFDRDYQLKYRLWQNPSDKSWHISNIRNISGGGLLFATNRPLAPGLPLEIIINELPSPLKVKGEILRMDISSGPAVFDVAAKFESLTKKKQDNLQAGIKKTK